MSKTILLPTLDSRQRTYVSSDMRNGLPTGESFWKAI
jgi:hypothetical protein